MANNNSNNRKKTSSKEEATPEVTTEMNNIEKLLSTIPTQDLEQVVIVGWHKDKTQPIQVYPSLGNFWFIHGTLNQAIFQMNITERELRFQEGAKGSQESSNKSPEVPVE